MQIKRILGTFDTNKAGEPFIAKSSGKPYKKQSVTFSEYGDVIVSLPVFNDKVYKEGDDVRGKIGEIREYNGKRYANWDFPKSKAKLAEEENAILRKKLAALEGK